MPVLDGPLNLFLRALNRFLLLCTLRDSDHWPEFKADYLTNKLPADEAEAVWDLVLYQRYSRAEDNFSDFLIDVILPKVVYCLSVNRDPEILDLLATANRYIKADPDFNYSTWRNGRQILRLARCMLNSTTFDYYDTSDEETTTDSD